MGINKKAPKAKPAYTGYVNGVEFSTSAYSEAQAAKQLKIKANRANGRRDDAYAEVTDVRLVMQPESRKQQVPSHADMGLKKKEENSSEQAMPVQLRFKFE